MGVHIAAADRRRRRLIRLSPIALWSGTCAIGLVLVVFGTLGWLAAGSVGVLRAEGVSFLTGSTWSYRHGLFGALPMFYGSAVVSLIALALAGPVGLGAAAFVSEICRPALRLPLKAVIELLAGVPSVVYGLLGILVLRERVYDLLEGVGMEPLSGDTLLTAGILLAVMILPTIVTLADDALHSVPAAERDAARGLGLTRTEVIASLVVPRAFPGLTAALFLALGRALGETIAVFLVVGRADNVLPDSLLSLAPVIDAGQTITSKLGGAETNIAVGDPTHFSAILALSLALLAGVLGLAFAGQLIRRPLRRSS